MTQDEILKTLVSQIKVQASFNNEEIDFDIIEHEGLTTAFVKRTVEGDERIVRITLEAV